VKEFPQENYGIIQWKQRKGKIYLLLREEREEVHKFISEQLRKGYIRLLKSSQTTLVFFVGKKNSTEL